MVSFDIQTKKLDYFSNIEGCEQSQYFITNPGMPGIKKLLPVKHKHIHNSRGRFITRDEII